MGRCLDLRSDVPPDEPMVFVDVDGKQHRVRKYTVWQMLELQGLDEAIESDRQRVRELIKHALPTLSDDRLDSLTVDEYNALTFFLVTGRVKTPDSKSEAASNEPEPSDPTPPAVPFTEPSETSEPVSQ